MSALAPEEAIGAGVCAKCGKSITHPGPDGECVRCLVSFGFLSEDDEPQQGREKKEVRLGPLRYAHFEVETNSDGYPVILGSGAMAITYRARDTVLNSAVALKVISRKLAEEPTARARFLREARAAAQIQHPNVARVIHYGEQDGECFYAMELVHGETLEERVRRDGPLPLSLALEVVEQTARGLAAGEQCGVVHRDLKPSNVMIESHAGDQLLVKIIDYGVAKVLAPQADATYRTQAGFIGTPAFASPEQFDEAGRQQIDTRSDIYSLGVTFWYLLTAQMPFAGRSIEEVRAKQAEALPLRQLKSAHIPLECVALLKSMLAEDAGERPQTARELLARIHRCYVRFEPAARQRRKRLILASVGLALVVALSLLAKLFYQRTASDSALDRAIAVLPFENLSRDPDNAYFAEGMQDEILARLSKIADLKVISRTSTQKYKSTPYNLREIAKQLGVANVVEGSVQKAADQVRVNVQLINALNDTYLWGDIYDRKLTDIFTVESEIAKTIADTLKAKLTGAEKQLIAAQPTSDLTAYELYLKGRLLWSKRGVENIRQAIAFYEQAIARDPNYALAYAGLAEAYMVLPRYAESAPQETYPKAKAAALKALQLDDKLAEAHTALGYVLWVFDFDIGSISEFQRAIALDPNSANAHKWYGNPTLVANGRFDEAIKESKRAAELDPLSIIINSDLGWTLILAGRYDEAIAQFHKTLKLDPAFYYAHLNLGLTLQLKGDLSAAIAEYVKAQQLSDDPEIRVRLATAKARSGDTELAAQMLAELEELSRHRYVHIYWRVLLYLSLGNRDEAIRWLEKGITEHEGRDLAWIKVDPLLNPLRGDPRFEALVQKVVGPRQK